MIELASAWVSLQHLWETQKEALPWPQEWSSSGNSLPRDFCRQVTCTCQEQGASHWIKSSNAFEWDPAGFGTALIPDGGTRSIYSDSGALRTLSNAPDLIGSIPAVSPKNSYHTTIESVPETAPSCTAGKCSFFAFVYTHTTDSALGYTL